LLVSPTTIPSPNRAAAGTHRAPGGCQRHGAPRCPWPHADAWPAHAKGWGDTRRRTWRLRASILVAPAATRMSPYRPPPSFLQSLLSAEGWRPQRWMVGVAPRTPPRGPADGCPRGGARRGAEQ